MQEKTYSQHNEQLKDQKVHRLILFNDDFNTFEHVIVMLMEYCGHTEEQAEQCAWLTHLRGKCAVKEGSYTELEPIAGALLDHGLSVEIV